MKRLICAVLLSAVVLAGGCASTPHAGMSAEEIVAQRGRERWDAIFAGDYDVAYAYLSPGYRAKFTRTDYMLRLAAQRVRWVGAEFQEAECGEELCEAVWEIRWVYNVPVRGVGTYEGLKTLRERWILADGEWYFVPVL